MRASILSGIVINALLVSAACPFMDGAGGDSDLRRRQDDTKAEGDDGFLDQFTVNDDNTYVTTDFGTPVDDRRSLKAGIRGGVLLEDFVMRTKITRFDHERIPERAGELLQVAASAVVRHRRANHLRRLCSTRTGSRRSWLLRVLRRLVQRHCGVIPGPGREENPNLPQIFNCCWFPRKCRHRQRRSWICFAFLHR
jgi:hypothetical protein